MTCNVPYILRKSKETDNNFIYNTWLKVYHETSPINFCPNNIYFTNQSKVIEKLLARSNVLIACQPEDPDSIIGYIVYEEVSSCLVVHWMFIKSIFRFMGLTSDIINNINPSYLDSPIFVSHNSKYFRQMKSKFNLVYDPYVIERKL